VENENNLNISLKWLKFHIYWRIPFGTFVGILNFLNFYINMDYWSIISVFAFVLDVASIVVFILTFIYAKSFTKRGYYLLYITLIIECITMSVYATENYLLKYNPDTYFSNWLIFISIFLLIWFLPNHVYFGKRKHLFIYNNFNKEKNKDTVVIEEKNVSLKTTYCKKCGGKLNSNKQCQKCGKQYFNIKGIPLITIIISCLLVVSFFFNIHQFINIQDDNDEIIRLNNQIESLTLRNLDLVTQKNNYEEKAEFLDESIVIVVEGYGNNYYTYDCVQKLTNGKKYTFLAFNKAQAIAKGYKKGSC